MLIDFPRSAFLLDRTASTWRKEAYSCCCLFRFSCSPRPKREPLQTKKPLQQLRKPSKPLAIIANEAKTGREKVTDSVKLGRHCTIDCFADISSEECERRMTRYSETRSRSNVSGGRGWGGVGG